MTLATQTRVAGYVGNGVTTVFPFNFPIRDPDDVVIQVYNLTDLTYITLAPSDYIATGIGPASTGGSITYAPGGIPIDANHKILIYRTVQYTQDLDIVNQAGFYPDTLEEQLDQIVMQVQQIAEGLSRALIIPPVTDVDLQQFVLLVLQIVPLLDEIQTLYDMRTDIQDVAAISAAIQTVANNLTDITNFNDVYLGARASTPTTRTDGSPLQVGDLYFRTTAVKGMYVYDGTSWLPTASTQTTGLVYSTRAVFAATSVSPLTNVVNLEGYTTSGDGGGGTYVKLGAPPGVTKAWHVQTADGAWWELRTAVINAKQLNAKGDNATDDSVALQAWLDYALAFNVKGMLSNGTYLVPTASLIIGTGVIIEGMYEKSTIKRTTDIDVPLISGTSLSGTSIRDIRLESLAGAASTSSHTVTTGSKVFTVAAGLNFVNGGNIMVISTVNPTVILTGTVTSGAGTTSMTLNITAAQGTAGTYTSWTILRYSGANTAIGYYSCTNCDMKNIIVVGKFYVGLENREGSGGIITGCRLTGVVNRPIYCQAAGAGSDDLTISQNVIIGAGITQYGISVFGSVGLVKNCNVINNRLSGIYFHGIGVGGLVSDCSVSNNNLEGFASSAYGILIERGNNLTPQGICVNANTLNNVGTYGIYLIDCFYCAVTGNRITSGVNGIYVIQVNPATTCQYHNITGNNMNAIQGNGITLASTAASAVSDVTVIGNTAVGTGGGIGVSFGANTTRCTSNGNSSAGFGTAYSHLGTSHGVGTNV